MGLATAPGAVIGLGSTPPTVLVPNRAVAQGLQRGLAACGLPLKTAGNTCQTPAQWLDRLARSPLAMPLPVLEPAHWWQPLQRQPLHLPLWLVLPTGWQQQTVLSHTAEQLQAHPAQGAEEGA
jgi:hypothetical protein